MLIRVIMRYSAFFKIGALATGVLAATLCLSAQKQSVPPENPYAKDAPNLPPRATPADYQAQARAGTITIAAEFDSHSVPTPEGTLTTEDYVVVEAGLFGAPGTRITLSPSDFSLRVNGKKTPSPSVPYGVVLKNLKDPTWEPPESESETKSSKTTIGGGEKDPSILPHIVRMPIELQRAMEKKAQRASMPEGDHALPVAGMLFFEHRGKINSVELVYTGPAGKATVPLQP
jgi:hypothetical protein